MATTREDVDLTQARLFKLRMEQIWGDEDIEDFNPLVGIDEHRHLAENPDDKYLLEDARVQLAAMFPEARVEEYKSQDGTQMFHAHFADGSKITFGHHEVH